jgi:hypothetical protein
MEGAKPTSNSHLGTLNLAKHLDTDVGKAVSFNRPKMGSNGLVWGVAAPRVLDQL